MRNALRRLSDQRPFLHSLKYAGDRAEIQYWEEAESLARRLVARAAAVERAPRVGRPAALGGRRPRGRSSGTVFLSRGHGVPRHRRPPRRDTAAVLSGAGTYAGAHDRRRLSRPSRRAPARPPTTSRWPPGPPRTPRCSRWPTRWSAATDERPRRQRRGRRRRARDGRHPRRACSTGCRLDAGRVAAMADGLRDVAGLPDPVGEVVRGSTLANGLELRQVRVPFGVVGDHLRGPAQRHRRRRRASASSPATRCCCAARRAPAAPTRRSSRCCARPPPRPGCRPTRCSWCRGRATSRPRS